MMASVEGHHRQHQQHQRRSAWDEDEDNNTVGERDEDEKFSSSSSSLPSSSSSSSVGSAGASPVRQSSGSAVHERRVENEGEDLSEDQVFSQVFRSRDPKELMFLALLEREFLKLLEKPLDERLKTNLKFPPMNGWYRLLLHKTAGRFRMKSVSDGEGSERSATVSCSDRSKAPGLLFSDMYPTGSMKFANFLRVPDPNFKQSLNDDEEAEEEDSFFSDPRVPKKKKKKRRDPKAGHQLYVPAHRRAQALAEAGGVTRTNETIATIDKKTPESPPKPAAKKKETQKYYVPAHRRRQATDDNNKSEETESEIETTTTEKMSPSTNDGTPKNDNTNEAADAAPASSTPPTSPTKSPTAEPQTIDKNGKEADKGGEEEREEEKEKKEDPVEESNLLFNYAAFFAQPFPLNSELASGSQGGDAPGVGQNVLEIYGFHPSTMTEDLEALLGLFGTQFRIKWVDDTHALAIFSTAALAERALRTLNNDPEFKLRPLSEASEATKRCCDLSPVDLTPPAPRPATCTKVATRMILNALNVRSPNKGRGKK
eukprot:TRINITY_DN11802_c0_g1_i1.p1 TRINITY_DN11802_c0_g1~~TRINITY_DN11802_c0_g1_i1.p1  ORF type:complete len:542 (-),score=178.60 TRINITY_DN11802_c0_g1_i1:59-1684(-)